MSSSETLELDSGLSKIGRLQIALGHPIRGHPRSAARTLGPIQNVAEE